MRTGILKNKTQDEVLAKRIKLCQGMWKRLKGLLGTHDLPSDHACWIIPCNSVHTVGMRYPIDVYFLDRANKIISIIEDMKPNRFSPLVFGAHSVLEFKSGAKRNVRVGDEFKWEEHP
jgi:uncharacterized protein